MTVRSTLAATLVAMSCATEPSPGDGTTGGTTGSGDTTSGADASTAAEVTTVSPTGVSASGDPDGDSSSGEPPPPVGPPCSVQVVTEGALYDPLERGEAADLFPTTIADVLEDYCGCHTLRDGAENLAWPGLQAPGGTNFLTFADLDRPYGAITLGMSMHEEVGAGMPPGSCSFLTEPRMLLVDWFDQGMPDGASYVP